METVDVVLSGTVLPGFDPREAAASLAAMTGLSQDKALALLTSGQPKLAKRGLSPEAAQALTEKFAVMGVAAFVRTPGDAATSPSAPTAPEKPAPSPEGSESIPLAKPEPGLSTPALSLNKDQPDEEDEDFNPYAAPQADLSQTGPQKKGGYWRETSVAVPARQGVQWIKDAWAMVKSNPGTWIGALLLAWACLGIVGALTAGIDSAAKPWGQIANQLASSLLGSFFAGGLALLAHRQTENQAFSAADLFAAFQSCPGRMLQLVGLELAYSFVVGLFLGIFMPLASRMMDKTTVVVLAILLGLVLFLPLIPAFFIAPTLVAVAGQRPFQSMKQSFLATCKNWRPVLINSLILGAVPGTLGFLALLVSILVAVRSGEEAGLVTFVLACLMIGLICLPLFILLPAVIYRAVREMFYEAGEEEVSDATRVS